MRKLTKYYKLTKPQYTIWLSEHFNNAPINNIVGTMYFNELIDIDLLKKAINITVKNNDALRTTLIEQDGDILQYFDTYNHFDIQVINFVNKSKSDIDKFLNHFYTFKFDLLNNFLFDFIILILPDNKVCLVGKFHHIIADAWTLGLIIDNVAVNYSNLVSNLNIELPSNSYIDFIEREKNYLNSDNYFKNKNFWTEYLKDYTPIHIKSTSNKSNIASRKLFNLSLQQSIEINDFCHLHNISAYTLFSAVLNIYLHRSTMQDDITITTPILNRLGKEKQTMGMFINMMSMHTKFNSNMTVFELIKDITTQNIMLFKNSKYPYIDVLSDLRKIKPNLNSTTYSIVLSFQNMRPKKHIANLVDYKVEWNFTGYSQDELVINISDINNYGNYSISYDYLINLFSETEIDYLHSRLLNIINEIIHNDLNIKISEINIITSYERNKLLNDFNNTEYMYDTSSTIISLFEDTVKKYSNNIAIKYNDLELSYTQLNNLSNIIAQEIINKKIYDSKVTIICDRSELMVASIIGVLKSGNCYIPIDPAYPEQRVNYIIEDSNSQLLITTNEYVNKYNFNNIINLNKLNYNSHVHNVNLSTPNHLCYIIYTSGTTGKPKGVQIKHKNIVNTLIWRKNLYLFNETDSILQIPSFSFDSSVEDIFTPLISGAKIIIPPITKMDINIICNEMKENKITHFLIVPSLYKILLNENPDVLKYLRIITIAGENFPISLIQKHFSKFPHVRVINEYGPTENSVCSTFYEITKKDNKVLIGKPINNCKCYCLDKNKQLLPIGIEGELYLSGTGLSCGYLNNNSITVEKFSQNNFLPQSLLYKTGDIVKYDFNGNLEFVERNDNQIKLHGFRIELKEIENIILQDTTVKDVIVNIQSFNNSQFIVAYITGKDINIQNINIKLREQLPYYMVPKIVVLDQLPLNPNGKIDRKKLPLPQIDNVKSIHPTNKLEAQILSICQDVLNNRQIGITDDLFTIGNADSLSILTITSRLFNIGLNIDTQDFYKFPNIKDLVSSIATADNFMSKPQSKIVNPFPTYLQCFDIDKIHFSFNNVLLTGCTGFLGIHILDCLLENTNVNIYCLIREKNNQSPQYRFKKLLTYYFDFNYYNKYKKRIHIIPSDVSLENFGLPIYTYNNLKQNIDCVINCAGNTKHYGSYKSFEKGNIQTVKNLIQFCLDTKIILNHMSTINVCGNYLVNNNIKYNFTENDFFFGQNYADNAYIYSKFEAERLIIENEYLGLNANIFRLGNLMGRIRDGKFQINKLDNAYYTRLLAFAKIGYIPFNLKNQLLEFSPVDDVTMAIYKLLCVPNLNKKIFHIFTDKLINVSVLIDVFKHFNINCNFISADKFKTQLLKNENKDFIKYIINDFKNNKFINYNSSITVDNFITLDYLAKLNFKFNTINEDYLIQFFNDTNFTLDFN